MTDEEKKAIEWLKKADWFSARLYSPTILNLIEKQQKEIEDNKKYNRKAELSKLLKVIADRIEVNSVSNDNIMQFVESYEKIYKLYEVIK